ncbi:MAG: hypothetical protein ABIF08_01140 [Nanoarchaeota archaeon]
MKPELLFFRYAFPCTRTIVDRGDIDQETYSKLEELAKQGRAPGFDELENTYKNAFKIMKKLYGDKHKNGKSIEKYWREGDHNKEIDEHPDYKDKTEEFKKLCKIRQVKVAGRAPYFKETLNWLVVKESENSDEQIAWNPYNLELKKGETVNIHHNIIIEKVTSI